MSRLEELAQKYFGDAFGTVSGADLKAVAFGRELLEEAAKLVERKPCDGCKCAECKKFREVVAAIHSLADTGERRKGRADDSGQQPRGLFHAL